MQPGASDQNRWVDVWFDRLFGDPLRPLVLGLVLLIAAFFFEDHQKVGTPDADRIQELVSFIFSKDLIHEFLRDLGIALIIASVIAYAIERRASEQRRREFNEYVDRVSDNAITAFLKRDMPENCFDFFKQQFSSQNFIRRNLRVEYEISKPQEEQKTAVKDGFVLVKNRTSYTVRNISGKRQEYAIAPYVERPLRVKLDDFVGLDTIEISGKALSEEQLKVMDKAVKNNTLCKKYKHTINMEANEEVSVIVSFTTAKYERDSQAWCNMVLAETLIFTVKAHKDYTVFGTPIHKDVVEEEFRVSDGKQESLTLGPLVPPYTMIDLEWMCADDAKRFDADLASIQAGVAAGLPHSAPLDVVGATVKV